MNTNYTLYEQLVFLPYLTSYKNLIEGAVRLDVFSKLETPLSAEELAADMNWHPVNTHHLLEALRCIGFLHHDGDLYQNTPDVSRYLVKGSPYYMGDMLLFSCMNKSSAYENLVEQVRKGPVPQTGLPQSLDFASAGEAARISQTGIRQQEILDLVRSLPENNKIKHILDLGCGAGMLGIALTKDEDERTAVLFDQPSIRPLIEKSLALCGMEKRIRIMTGDFLTDDIGNGYDLILCSWIMFAAISGGASFFSKLKSVLNPRGLVLCLNEGIEPDFSAPWDMALWFLTYHFQGMPLGVLKGTVSEAAQKAGFTSIEYRTLLLSSGTHDIHILRI